MLDRLQQLPVGAVIPLVFLAAVIGIGLALMTTRRRR
jgi:hypothetical protein